MLGNIVCDQDTWMLKSLSRADKCNAASVLGSQTGDLCYLAEAYVSCCPFEDLLSLYSLIFKPYSINLKLIEETVSRCST